MPAIQITSKELRSRGGQIQKLLRPLARKLGGPAWKAPAWKARGTPQNYIIGTHDGSPPLSGYRDWRFATFVPNFRGMYFERWIQFEDDLWYLDRAYLSIFRTDPDTRSETKFLCLHCDPNESDDAPHAIYKRGPHLHIQVAPDPIPHAHIALNRGHLEAVLSSAESLSEAIGWAVLMLKEEVLDAIKEVSVHHDDAWRLYR